MKNDYLQRLKYIFWDIIAACLSYTALYSFRRLIIERERFEGTEFTFSQNYYLGLVLVALFWVTIYWITGFYRDIYRRSRLKEFIYTFNSALLGSIFIFFALILDDWVSTYTDYYRGFLVYFSAQFLTTATLRFLISTRTSTRIRRGKIWFNTILIGSNENAVDLYTDMASTTSNGNRFVGFVSVHNNIRFLVEKNLEHLGTHIELPQIIEKEQIEEVIIAIES
ncbi:MAG: nucleoside-diphosphate sugar epimerase/dehydratase, partial [Owenweeksia sp.]